MPRINLKDMVSKTRQMHGETHHKAKLTRSDVIDIRKSHAKLLNELTHKYKVSKELIRSIINKKTWKTI